jgi:hypothetical protein
MKYARDSFGNIPDNLLPRGVVPFESKTTFNNRAEQPAPGQSQTDYVSNYSANNCDSAAQFNANRRGPYFQNHAYIDNVGNIHQQPLQQQQLPANVRKESNYETRDLSNDSDTVWFWILYLFLFIGVPGLMVEPQFISLPAFG